MDHLVSSRQIKRLHSRFKSLDRKGNGSLSREDFLKIPELTVNPLADRIVEAFFVKKSPDDRINFHQFIRVLGQFRLEKNRQKSQGKNLKEKLQFNFRMYDLNEEDKITRQNLLQIVTVMAGSNISREKMISMVERTLLEVNNLDSNKYISFDNFCKIVQRAELEEKISIGFWE